MFFLGLVFGALLVGLLWWARQRGFESRLQTGDRERSNQFRRITELERLLAESKSLTASADRAARLRSEREFSQYKILLRRADRALAEAKAKLRATSDTDDEVASAA